MSNSNIVINVGNNATGKCNVKFKLTPEQIEDIVRQIRAELSLEQFNTILNATNVIDEFSFQNVEYYGDIL